TRLSQAGISVNPVAGYYHDHLFVPNDRAMDAMTILKELSHQTS
ncbi:MAG: ACT domain-containing protein, partial [Cyanobacteria bacterium J06626_14]